jgi:cytochrome P450
MVGFIQAMALFPEVQKKAQDEMDKVIGSERMPNLSDESNLPYIRAMMKETLRWMPTTISGAVPHASSKDDYYNGYFIPKGSSIMLNVWSINMDENRHPNPREFRPERYEGDGLSAADSAALADVAKRDHFTFGAGRRICQGIHIAERSLFLGIARMIWGFNVTPKIKDGKQVEIDSSRLTQGFVCMPDTFECDIRPRDEKRVELMRREWRDAMGEYLDKNEQLRDDVSLESMSSC